MMLATSALVSAATTAAATVFSPSRNACVQRVAPQRFIFNPYAAPVLPPRFGATTAVAAQAAYAGYSDAAAFFAPAPSVTLYPADCGAAYSMPATISPAKTFTAAAYAATAPVVATVAPIDDLSNAAAAMMMAATRGAKANSAPRFAIVRFKHESVTYLAPFRINVGDVVVVEGDRGENIGVVGEITQAVPSYDVPCRVVRRATERDLANLAQQRERESLAVKATQALANSLGLSAVIEDAEYQYDGQKLTVFVRRATRNAFVDFRKLQRGLFREFRCRIWCAYMDEVEAAEAGPRTR